uniref:Uncharacterized protein n=1 Tax=Toxocara canis TaxID=6265 RepID=A0A183VE68_TOXCA
LTAQPTLVQHGPVRNLAHIRLRFRAACESTKPHKSSATLGRKSCVFFAIIGADREGEEWDEDASSDHHSEHGLLPPTFATLLPADSLELLPIGARRQSDIDGRRQSAIVRKYSEPCLEGICHGWGRTPRRLLSDAEPRATRKSYPSKMSSTAAFLSEGLAIRCEPSASDSVSFHVGSVPVSSVTSEPLVHCIVICAFSHA